MNDRGDFMAVRAERRVVSLYRVSKMEQVIAEDIPLQKNACREFINNQQGWKLVKEYYEKGVSGFSVTLEKREVLQQIIQDAKNGLFNILVVFMFDRLGRVDSETPYLVEWFHNIGVEVWSVVEGNYNLNKPIDKILNHMTYWQSDTESKKTSVRVNEKHKQMVREGQFRGGKPPYGYKLIKSGFTNKKGKDLLELAIHEEESKIVKIMFHLVLNHGYGGNRIARYLNEKSIKSRTGGNWTVGVINYILRNPIYKGYLAYGKAARENKALVKQERDKWILADKPNQNLITVDESIWNNVQAIRSSRTPEKIKKEDTLHLQDTGSPLILIGKIHCGHCGSPLTTTYNYKKWTTKDGTTKKRLRPKYRCSGKALNKTPCEGQTIYSQERIEKIVFVEVSKYVKNLEETDTLGKFHESQFQRLDKLQQEIKSLQESNEDNYVELTALTNEVAKSLTGNSCFKQDLLSSLINQKETEIDNINRMIQEVEKDIRKANVKILEINQLQNYLGTWEKELLSSSYEKKKTMINLILENVIVTRWDVQVEYKYCI